MRGLNEAVAITATVTRILESLGVKYAVGGSVASSLRGIPRATMDVDIVAAMREEHVEPFVAALGSDFYVDADMIRDAIRHRTEFNLIHQPTVFKIDVFVPRLDLVARRELSRATEHEAGGYRLRVISAEDVIAQKLHWYRLGNHISERQWSDAAGVVKTHRGRLDLPYVRETAEALGVLDLLERLLAENA